MAKQARQAAVEFTDRDVNKFVADILERYVNIESARGKFMLAARREREGMQATYEGMAARGLAQKIAKIEIEIIRLVERIKGKVADLDHEQRKMLEKLARAQGDKRQLSLLLEVPQPPKPPKAEKPPKAPKPPKKPKLNVVPITPPEETADAPSAA